jgi:hypothetical protein
LNGVTRRLRQRIEGFGECGRPDLKRTRHRLFRLTSRVLSGRNFAP